MSLKNNDNNIFLDYLRIIDTNAINAIDSNNFHKIFKHKDVFPTPFQTKPLKPYQRLYIPFTKRLFGNDSINFQFNVPGTDYSFTEGKIAEYFPAQPSKMFVYLLNEETNMQLKKYIADGNKQEEAQLRFYSNKIYNDAIDIREKEQKEQSLNKNLSNEKFVNAIKSHWSLNEIDHSDWVLLLKNKSIIPDIKLKNLLPKLEYVHIWNNLAPCNGPNGMKRSRPECLYLGTENHNEMLPGSLVPIKNKDPRGCVWTGKNKGCKQCKSLKTVEECGQFPVQCAYNKMGKQCIPRTLQDEYNLEHNIPAVFHNSTPLERTFNKNQISTRHVHNLPNERLLMHEHPNDGNHTKHSALQIMQSKLNDNSITSSVPYKGALPNGSPSRTRDPFKTFLGGKKKSSRKKRVSRKKRSSNKKRKTKKKSSKRK